MTPNVPAHPVMRFRSKLADNANAHPLDVMKAKSTLKTLGHYDAPEWGVSPYPDPELFGAVKAFQKSQGLKTDGVINPDGETEAVLSQMLTPQHAQNAIGEVAQTLHSMGRDSGELIAQATPEEVHLLQAFTDGNLTNTPDVSGGNTRPEGGNGFEGEFKDKEKEFLSNQIVREILHGIAGPSKPPRSKFYPGGIRG